MTSIASENNPYRPSIDPIQSKPDRHHWKEHTIDVTCHADRKRLWLGNTFSVVIDDERTHHQSSSQINTEFRFPIIDDAVGRIVPSRGFNATRMRYRLLVSGHMIGEGRTSIRGWYITVLVFTSICVALYSAFIAFLILTD